MLVVALLHPCMPSFMVCEGLDLFTHFCNALILYHSGHAAMVKSHHLPLVSKLCLVVVLSDSTKTHKVILKTVTCSHQYHF